MKSNDNLTIIFDCHQKHDIIIYNYTKNISKNTEKVSLNFLVFTTKISNSFVHASKNDKPVKSKLFLCH